MTAAAIEAQVVTKGSFEPLIKGLSDKTQRGILRASLRRAAQQTVLKEARKNVREVAGSRHAKSMIAKSTATNKVAFAAVGAKKGTAWSKIGHLIEGGTRSHSLRARKARVMVGRDGIFYGTKAVHPGTRAKPWLVPAWATSKMKAVGKFGVFIVEEIDKAVAKGKR